MLRGCLLSLMIFKKESLRRAVLNVTYTSSGYVPTFGLGYGSPS